VNQKIFFAFIFLMAQISVAAYRVGASRTKITGPIYGPHLMGYANAAQKAQGIHMDLFSRAIVIEDSDSQERVALVSLDLSQVNEALKRRVMERLHSILGDRFQDSNVLLAATHTHSALGGLSHYHLYNIASFGFEPENFEVVSERIVESIVQAQRSLEPAELDYVVGEMPRITQNRSLEPFKKNAEAKIFAEGIDSSVQQINFRRRDGSLIALWNVFPIHGTSIPNSER
jgi:neutral ceramidase